MNTFNVPKRKAEIPTISSRPELSYYAGVDEAAMLANVSRKTILDRIHQGELETVKFGRAFFITRISLDKSNIARSTPPPGPRFMRMARVLHLMTAEPSSYFPDEKHRKAVHRASGSVLKAEASGNKCSDESPEEAYTGLGKSCNA